MKAIIDVIVAAVQVVPRVETKLYSEKPWKAKVTQNIKIIALYSSINYTV
jgi:hypothetical protein